MTWLGTFLGWGPRGNLLCCDHAGQDASQVREDHEKSHVTQDGTPYEGPECRVSLHSWLASRQNILSRAAMNHQLLQNIVHMVPSRVDGCNRWTIPSSLMFMVDSLPPCAMVVGLLRQVDSYTGDFFFIFRVASLIKGLATVLDIKAQFRGHTVRMQIL